MKTKITYHLRVAGFMAITFSSVIMYGSNNGVIKGMNTTASVAPSIKQQLDATLKNYQVYQIDAKTVHAAVVAMNSASSDAMGGGLSLQLGTEKFDLNIHPRDFTGKEFKFLVSYPEGVQAFPDIPVETYQGYVNGDPSQATAFSINEKEFKGVMQNNKENFYIEPLSKLTADAADANQYVFYNAKDVISETRVCGVNDLNQAKEYIDNNAVSESAAAGCTGMRIALVCDNYFYKGKGSDPVRTALDMVHNLNMAEAMYFQSSTPATSPGGGYNLHFRITVIYVATNSNEITPDSQMDSNTLLANFTSWANGGTKIKPADYDVAAMFTKRNYVSGGSDLVFGLAYLSAGCSNTKYLHIKSDWGFMGDVFESMVLTHEIGHTLGANHTTGLDIMSASSSDQNTTWGTTTPPVINAFISGHTGCIKACTTFAPEPDFDADIKVGCGGTLAVNFTNKTDFTDSPTTYSWDFGDGQTSTQQNPAHTYNAAGSYTVSLTATNANGSLTETKKDFIYVGTTANAAQAVPVTTTNSGTGGYSTAPTFYPSVMQFQALDDIELVSMKMQGNEAGQRLLSLTMDSSRTIIDQKVVTLPAKVLTSVNLNWRLKKGKTYQIVVARTGSINGTMYYNNLLRITGTSAILPKTITGLITVNANHLNMGGVSGYDPTGNNYWYIGYEWQVRRLCSTSVGINTVEQENVFNVFPSPGDGHYTLNFSKTPEAKAKVEVYNVLGEVVYTKSISISTAYISESIDISYLPAGTYLLKLNSGESQMTKSLVKLNE